MNAPPLDQIVDAVIAAFPKLSAPERVVSLVLYRLLAKGEPVVPEKISEESGESLETIAAMLATWHGVQRSAKGSVTAFWGLTLSNTRHRFRVDGRALHTWCAWDTLFLPQLLGATGEVESTCPVNGKAIRLRVGPRGVEAADPQSIVLSFVMPREADVETDVINRFCCHVHFFATTEAANAWLSVHPDGFFLSLADAWQIGVRKNIAQFGSLGQA